MDFQNGDYRHKRQVIRTMTWIDRKKMRYYACVQYNCTFSSLCPLLCGRECELNKCSIIALDVVTYRAGFSTLRQSVYHVFLGALWTKKKYRRSYPSKVSIHVFVVARNGRTNTWWTNWNSMLKPQPCTCMLQHRVQLLKRCNVTMTKSLWFTCRWNNV